MGLNMLSDMLKNMGEQMGMSPLVYAAQTCGVHLEGNGKKTKGYLWYYIHEEYLSVVHCDFVFCEDCKLAMPPNALYIALRLDEFNHLPPGRIVSFMEEKGRDITANMKKGMRIAYTEVIYSPAFYRKHLVDCFSVLNDNPVEILKNMGGEHNWPSEMVKILYEIRQCSLDGMAAELFYVAKSYELMSMLIRMGNNRSPKNAADYERILTVVKYIDEHYMQEVRQETLVKLSQMSSTKLKNLFKRFTGRNITGYILEKRADSAVHLLLDTGLSVEEISAKIGFETATGFSTSFKKHTGISPSAYRKRMQFNCFKDPSQKKEFAVR
ncbi:AraC-like DNA-binding protein [Ruminiclostridium sufflavum DSM 19573]|uniref:AraC-like DNA-binding protein n=1 Tax=Ruminiclostridium sufflavum DSM 19573 TaxID=1121337 RepID=A0A318XQK6_9FIRM|nr:AraC family transcriptional regulator [Ruminiclostridium sufflavum]PYG89738.1 AraC-like DNA-binding protein [Ruminiclostridium sufflavum DSM 19573]